ncbi:MAG: hypothetical protein Q9217_004663, partial [Psora testacea]
MVALSEPTSSAKHSRIAEKPRHESRSCKNRHEQVNRLLAVNPPFEIRPSLNKGLGVFARIPIPRASIIIRDQLVLRYEQGEKPQQKYRRFLRLPTPIQEEVLKLAVLQDVKRSMAAGLKLLLDGVSKDVIAKVMHLEDVLSTNAFEIVVDDPQTPAGLFLTASRLNHSCVPNADRFCGNESKSMSFVANRDITEGEEITISYITHLKHRTERQLELRRWVIVCQCPVCDIDHPDSRAHEYRLKRIARLYQDRCMDNSGRLEAGVGRSRNMLELTAKRARERIMLLSEHCSFHKFLRQA